MWDRASTKWQVFRTRATQQITPAPGRENPEVPPDEVHRVDITFLNCKAPREIKRAVAKLHINLGHPSSADLVRILA